VLTVSCIFLWSLPTQVVSACLHISEFATVLRYVCVYLHLYVYLYLSLSAVIYRGADKSLARPTSDVFCLMVRIFRLMLVLLHI
jgi:hypothetical protein